MVARFRLLAAAAALAVLALAPASPQDQDNEKLRITVTKGRLRIAIAVPLFLAPGQGAEQEAELITSTVRADLRNALLFGLADPVVYRQIPAHDESSIPFDSYERLGVEALALGNISKTGSDLEVEIRLFDVKQRARIFGRRVLGRPDQGRFIAHRISSHILYHLTGDWGIFDKKIVYTSTSDLGSDGLNTELWIMDYDGEGKRRITFSPSLKLFPQFGPGESGIFYTTYINNNPDIYCLNLRGGPATEVVASGAVDMTPAVSPDGRQIVYASSAGGNMDIYIANLDGSSPRKLTTSYAIDSSPHWSPNGRQIAFSSSRTGTPQIYVMNTDGSGQRRITYEGDYNDGAVWSPDGTMIAYSARRPRDRTFDIRIHDLATGQTYYVTRGPSNDEDPSWSPDGRFIAFSSDREGSYQIYTVAVDGRNLRKLTSSGVNKHPSWSY